MDHVLVSIIIPAYNASDLILEALASVQRQTYPHWEVIVVEDGSQDDAAAIVQTFAQRVAPHPVHYHRHPCNLGISTTRNTGITIAQGHYIALLDHDDLWEPEHLNRLVTALENSGADWAFSPAYFFHYATPETRLAIHGPSLKEISQWPTTLYNRCYIPVSSVVFRRSVYDIIGGFDSRLNQAEDLEYWLRCAAARLRVEYVPIVTTGYRQRNPKAATADKAKILEGHARVLRKHRHLGEIPPRQRGRVLARYHLGVARRSWRREPGKALAFLGWAVILAPMGTLSAIVWVVAEALGWSSRYLHTPERI